MNPGSQLSEMWSVSQMSQVARIALWRCSQCICLRHCLCLRIFHCHSHVTSSLWSNVTSLYDRSLKVLSKCICLCLCLCLCLCIFLYHFLFFGQIISPHHSDQMSLRSQVSRIALWWNSLNVFVFVIVFLLVRLRLLISLIKCLKGHMSLGSFFEGVL